MPHVRDPPLAIAQRQQSRRGTARVQQPRQRRGATMPQPDRSCPNQPIQHAVPRATAIVAQGVGHRHRVASPEARGHGRPHRRPVARCGNRHGQPHEFVGLLTGQHILIGAYDTRNARRIQRPFDFLRLGVGAHQYRYLGGANAVGYETLHFHRDSTNRQRGALFLRDAVLRRVVRLADPHPLQRLLTVGGEGLGSMHPIGRRDLGHADQLGAAGERLGVLAKQLRDATHHGIGAAKIREQRVPSFDGRGGLEIGVHIGVPEREDGLLRIADQEQRTPTERGREDRELGGIGVLKLVDQRYAKALADPRGQQPTRSFSH